MLVTCLDLDGKRITYRVPRRGKRQGCPDRELTALRLDVVRALFEGSPLERIDAAGALTEMQRWILFPPKCDCGADHAKFAANLMRCFRGLAPSARAKGAELELNLVQWIKLAGVQSDTPVLTERAQLVELMAFAFGGRAPQAPSESFDSAETDNKDAA